MTWENTYTADVDDNSIIFVKVGRVGTVGYVINITGTATVSIKRRLAGGVEYLVDKDNSNANAEFTETTEGILTCGEGDVIGFGVSGASSATVKLMFTGDIETTKGVDRTPV